MGHRLGLTTGAQISVCKAPSLSTGAAVPLTGAETVYCTRSGHLTAALQTVAENLFV